MRWTHPNTNTEQMRAVMYKGLVWGSLVLIGFAVLFLCWKWSISPRSAKVEVVIRTEKEATDAALDFLARAGVYGAGHEVSALPTIASDTIKGQRIWRVSLPLMNKSFTQSNLVVLVYETGLFRCDEMTSESEGTTIEGDSKKVYRKHFVLQKQ